MAGRLTPVAGTALVVAYGMVALYAVLSGLGTSSPVVAVVLLVGLALVAATVFELLLRLRRSVAAVAADAVALERREAALRSMVQGSGIGLALADAEGGFLEVNAAMASIVGRSPEDLKHTALPALAAPGRAAEVVAALGALRDGATKRWDAESIQMRPDGTILPVALSVTPVAGSDHQPILLVEETDLSVAKRAEAIREVMVAVRHAVAAGTTWEQAAPGVLGSMGERLGWDVAQYWGLTTDTDSFTRRQSWLRDPDSLAEFDRECDSLQVPATEGIFFRAGKSGVPAEDRAISSTTLPTLVLPARRASLNAVLVCPVTSGGNARGVIALFARQASDLETDVATMLTAAGSEVGQFMQRSDTVLALQRSEADHRAIFERAPIGIARISAEGELLEGNAALSTMLEHDFESLRDHAWPDLQRSYDLAAGKSRIAPLLAGISDGGTVQVRAATGSGRWLWLQMTATTIPDSTGRPEHVLVMVEDVTSVRDAQDRLAEALEAQRGANADLEKLDHTKTEFLSIVSHEFRTALTGIQGFSELIRDGGLEADELRAYGGYIFNDADRVNRLIGDMLDLDRMESGRMTIRMADVDINEVLSDALARAASAATAPAVEFKRDLDPRLPIVTGDRDRLVQVVSNLVNNAVKYSPEGGMITISSRAEGGFALISISDTGLGIPPDEISHVFERFRRVRTGAAQAIAGTGLGLTIVKQIVEMHGGRIWVESAVGHGSAFHFTIPLAADAVTAAAQLRHA